MSESIGTGFYDKRGREIRIGDLITDDTNTRYCVTHHDGYFWLFRDGCFDQLLSDADLSETEVVGNPTAFEELKELVLAELDMIARGIETDRYTLENVQELQGRIRGLSGNG